MRAARTTGRKRNVLALLVALTLIIASPTQCLADEGRVNFWLPGLFGSLAAVPAEPGPSFASPTCASRARWSQPQMIDSGMSHTGFRRVYRHDQNKGKSYGDRQ